jgi:GntR family histidine utilization transcriptional repressor
MIEQLADLDGDGPLWQQIRRALIRPMKDGRWPPGTKIPKEFEIIGRYGAARMTVHRAIRSLAQEGLVTRRRRFGTVVAANPPERPVLEIWDISEEVARISGDYSFEILDRTVIDAADPLAAPLGLTDGELLMLTVRHFSDGEPLQIERRLINLAAAPAARDESFATLPPGSWLIRSVAWSEAEHVILAEGASPEMARLLGVEAGSACLVVERRTWRESLPVTWARLVHPGDKRRLVGRFRSNNGD